MGGILYPFSYVMQHADSSNWYILCKGRVSGDSVGI
jgi:hypothetical protein